MCLREQQVGETEMIKKEEKVICINSSVSDLIGIKLIFITLIYISG